MTEPAELEMDPESIDFETFDFWGDGEDVRESVFLTLRRHRPMSFHGEPDLSPFPKGPGYWSVVRYDDVMHVSRHPDLFQSGQGTNVPDLPAEVNDLFGSMINMDAPRHTRMRLLVNRGFTPRMVGQLEAGVRDRARTIVDDVAPKGSCDFVTEIAAQLPLQIICDMMGIPPEDNQKIFDWSNVILGAGDPEYGEDVGTARSRPAGSCTSTGRRSATRGSRSRRTTSRRRSCTPEIDGERPHGRGVRVVLRAARRGGQRDDPQRDQPRHARADPASGPAGDLDGGHRRGAADRGRGDRPVGHAGHPLPAHRNGGHRDRRADHQGRREGGGLVQLGQPRRGRVRRPVLGSISAATRTSTSGSGPAARTSASGAHLARREINVMMRELLHRLPDIEVTGEPAMLLSPFIHGIKHLPVEYTAQG